MTHEGRSRKFFLQCCFKFVPVCEFKIAAGGLNGSQGIQVDEGNNQEVVCLGQAFVGENLATIKG